MESALLGSVKVPTGLFKNPLPGSSL